MGRGMIREIIQFAETIEDERQSWKVDHILSDIVITVLYATLANANNWLEIAVWAEYNEDLRKRFIELPKGTASHDTIGRVMARIKPEKFQELVTVWREFVNKDEGKKREYWQTGDVKENLNIARKWAISVLKTLDMGKGCSLKTKRFILCSSFDRFVSTIMSA